VVDSLGRATDGFSRADMEFVAPQSLEDENRQLREELQLCQRTQIQNATSIGFQGFQRRPMAAIAGGGFRGPQAASQPRSCMCDALRAKLARARAELEQARCEAATRRTPVRVVTGPALLPTPPELADAQVQASLESGPESPRRATKEVSMQAVAPTPARREVGAQAVQRGEVVGVQAGGGLASLPSASTQTVVAAAADAATQVAAVVRCDAEAQAEAAGEHVAMQTEPPPATVEAAAQAGCAPAPVAVVEVQTEPFPVSPQLADAAVQAAEEQEERAPEPPPPQPSTREIAVQVVAAGPAQSTVAVQATAALPACTSTAMQCEAPPKGVDAGSQAEDKVAKAKSAELEARLKDLESLARDLAAENSNLADSLRTAKEEAEVWQQAAQSRVLGQMNITILCPRAECTVNGAKVEMDSWNPAKLREEFEREVLPRFARVFVEDVPPNGGGGAAQAQGGKKPRPEAVERTMQEFADVFRERLSTMLNAPSAQAAAAAAGAATKPSSALSTAGPNPGRLSMR